MVPLHMQSAAQIVYCRMIGRLFNNDLDTTVCRKASEPNYRYCFAIYLSQYTSRTRNRIAKPGARRSFACWLTNRLIKRQVHSQFI